MSKRKIKSFKKKSLIRRGFVELGGGEDTFEVPIKTLSVTDERDIYIDMEIAIPYKDSIPTEEEKSFLTNDPSYNKKMYPMIRKYDSESVEYKKALAMKGRYESLLNVIKYIDLDYEISKGKTLWDDLGIEKGDWLGACKFFGDELGIRDVDIENILIEARSLKGDSMYEKIALLKGATGLDMMSIIDIAAKVVSESKETSEE